MDKLHSEQSETETAVRAEWVKPEMVTLDAGSAEVGDFASADGNIAS